MTAKNANSTPPWYQPLSTAMAKNYKSYSKILLLLNTESRDGEPSFHPLHLSEINDDDPRYLVFCFAHSNARLRGDVTSHPKAFITWQMPQTFEIYRFHGRFFMVPCNPYNYARFPPPSLTDQDANVYWEKRRLIAWSRLSQYDRASYTWPAGDQVRTVTSPTQHGFESISVTSSDVHPDSYTISKLKDMSTDKTSPLKKRHDLARDENFSLLVFRIDVVKYFELDPTITGGDEHGVGRRIEYEIREAKNDSISWQQTDLTP